MLCWELWGTRQALGELGGLEQEQGSTPGPWLRVAGLDSGLGAAVKEQGRATVSHHTEPKSRRWRGRTCPLVPSPGLRGRWGRVGDTAWCRGS